MSKIKERLKTVNPDIRNSFRKSDSIAQLIENKLKEKNWSKGRLADELGAKSQSVVTRYLTGQHNFTLNTIVELERALDCTLISVCGDENKDDSLINDSNVSAHLDKWYSDCDKKEYFKVSRNFSARSSKDSEYSYTQQGTGKNLAS